MKLLNRIGFVILIMSIVIFAGYNYRRKKNVDLDGPVINIENDLLEVSIHDDEAVLLQGITAFDAKDGDVTASVGVENISGFIEGHICQVDYVAFDNDNHVARASRKIEYIDYTIPKFSLDAPLKFPVASGVVDILENVHVEDCLDGDISKQVMFSGNSNVYVNVAADYKVELYVTNSVGDTQTLPVTVTFYNYTEEVRKPQIKLKNYLIYINQGESINYIDNIDSVTYGNQEYGITNGRGTYNVDVSEMTTEEKKAFLEEDPTVNQELFMISGEADTSTPGVYEVSYELDGIDNERGSIRLVVVVLGDEK